MSYDDNFCSCLFVTEFYRIVRLMAHYVSILYVCLICMYCQCQLCLCYFACNRWLSLFDTGVLCFHVPTIGFYGCLFMVPSKDSEEDVFSYK